MTTKTLNQGIGLNALIGRLQGIETNKKDLFVPTKDIHAVPTNAGVKLETPSGAFVPTNWARTQLANYSDIPSGYLTRINSEKPELAAKIINHGLEKTPGDRLLRTVGGTARAFVSPRFNRGMDAARVLDAISPGMLERELTIASADITDDRMYIKALSPRAKHEIKVGDFIQFGFSLKTSDVGMSSLIFDMFVLRFACTNGMVLPTSFRKVHLGKSLADSEIYGMLSNETKSLDDKAFRAKMMDIFNSALSEEKFAEATELMKKAAGMEYQPKDVNKSIDVTFKHLGISNELGKLDVLKALIGGNEGAGATQWGLANAFTSAAKNAPTYDLSQELEEAGGRIIQLNQTQWKAISA